MAIGLSLVALSSHAHDVSVHGQTIYTIGHSTRSPEELLALLAGPSVALARAIPPSPSAGLTHSPATKPGIEPRWPYSVRPSRCRICRPRP